MPRLLVFLSSGRATYELTGERITIGRAADNLIEISDPSVSVHHAQLILINGLYQLQDLQSTNGTRVNGESVTEVFLREGDRLHFGKVEARLESDASASAQPLPQAGTIEARPGLRSARPLDFANASPFQRREQSQDPLTTAAILAVGVAILAFLFSMLGLLQIHGPR